MISEKFLNFFAEGTNLLGGIDVLISESTIDVAIT